MTDTSLQNLLGLDTSQELLTPHSQDSQFRWATVTAASPLQIKLDNSTNPLDSEPVDLVRNLEVGARVWVQLVDRRVVILGRGAPDESRRSLASKLTWGSVSTEFTIRSIGKFREVRGGISGNLPPGGTSITAWWAIDEVDRPSLKVHGYASILGDYAGGISVTPDGQFNLFNHTASNRNGVHHFNFVYTVG